MSAMSMPRVPGRDGAVAQPDDAHLFLVALGQSMQSFRARGGITRKDLAPAADPDGREQRGDGRPQGHPDRPLGRLPGAEPALDTSAQPLRPPSLTSYRLVRR